MTVHYFSENLRMIDVEPPISGWDDFIGPYILGKEYPVLIDVGPKSSASNLIQGINELRIDPGRFSHILLTHVHIDHAGAIDELAEFLPNAKIVVHPKGVNHVIDPEKLWEGSLKTLGDLAVKYGQPMGVPATRIMHVEDGMCLALEGGMELQVIFTPGHAAHHMSFVDKKTGALFAGEAAGVYIGKADSHRPSTPAPFLLEQTLGSINKLLDCDPTTIYYAHFGMAKDAKAMLKRGKEELMLWHSVISEIGMQDEADVGDIVTKLMERDANLARLESLPKEECQRDRYFLKNSVAGFLGYIAKQRRMGNVE